MMSFWGCVATVLLILGRAAVAAEGPAAVSLSGAQILLEYDQAVRAVIDPAHGGELSGLGVLIDGEWRELIYRAADYSDQAGWRGKAPLLWPATGVSISTEGGKGSYTVGDRLYTMPMHGFARARPWKVVETSSSSDGAVALLELSDSGETRNLYPFGFRLRAEYRVGRCGVDIRYGVVASADNKGPMPFSIGNHITFRLPLIAGSAPVETMFEGNLPEELIVDDKRVFTGDTRASRLTGRHRVGELPQRRSVSLGGGVERPWIRVFDPSGFFVELAHEVPDGVPAKTVLFNLWADLEEGFFSPEPWIGAQNSLNSGYGLINVLPGQDWEWRIRIRPSTICQCDNQRGSP